ncbi:MAG: TolC family protein [Algisphaera sp.]
MFTLALSACLAPERSPFLHPRWEQALDHAERNAPARDIPTLQSGALPPATLSPIPSGPLELSVEETTQFALARNPELTVAQLEPVIAGAYQLIERGVFDPEAFAELRTSSTTTRETDRGTGGQFSVDFRNLSAGGGVRQNLPHGTRLQAEVTTDRDISNRTPEQQEARLRLSITQQLLRGAGPVANLARVHQAQLTTEASVYELRGYVEHFVAQVESAYWRYGLAGERIAIFERTLDVARRQRDDTEQRIAVGLLPETQAAAARAEVARHEQALIDARSDLESQRLQLLRRMGVTGPNAMDRALITRYANDINPAPITQLSDRIALAAIHRPDLAEAQLRLEQNRLETLITQNGLLPRLEVFAAFDQTGFSDRLDDAFGNLNGDTHRLTGGVRFSQWLDNDAARGRDRIAFATRRQGAAAVNNLKQLIELEVRLAANEAQRARQQITASRTTRELEEKVAQAEQKRFNAGSGTALLVAQAQRDLLAAQIAQAQAVVAWRLALVELYRAEGTLLERRGIVIETTTPADDF